MKILCVIDNLGTGGAQRQLINLARGLHRRSHDVSMFCYAEGALLGHYLEKEGIPVHVRLKKSRFSPDVVRALRGLIDRGRFEAVVSFLNTPNFYALLSSRLSKTRPAVIVSERFCDVPGLTNAVELAVRGSYRLSSMVVVNSHHQRMSFRGRYPWMKNRLVTIYNGYDLQEFMPPADEPDNAELAILAVASVSKYKNGLCLVRALDVLRKKHGLLARVRWAGRRAIAGDRLGYSSTMDGDIDRLGLRGQWEWLDQRKDIAALLREHDVLVHPSYGEGLPNVVCEAMACGRPVIVSDTLDHPRLVTDGVNGFLFDWRNPVDLADKLKTFHDLSRAERQRLGMAGRAYAEEHLSMERYVNDFERIIGEVVKQRAIPVG